jgi:hypothetical protein
MPRRTQWQVFFHPNPHGRWTKIKKVQDAFHAFFFNLKISCKISQQTFLCVAYSIKTAFSSGC